MPRNGNSDGTWIRNEWLFRNGAWSQTGAAVRDYGETERSMRELIASWSRNAPHQWIETDDLILGIPPDGSDNYYLVAFSRRSAP